MAKAGPSSMTKQSNGCRKRRSSPKKHPSSSTLANHPRLSSTLVSQINGLPTRPSHRTLRHRTKDTGGTTPNRAHQEAGRCTLTTRSAPRLRVKEKNNISSERPTEWTPLSTITQWLSGRNRQRPCTILSDLDAHQIQTWIGQEQDIASYIKSCDFIHWQQEINDVFLALRPSTTTPTDQPYRNQPTSLREPREEGRRIIVPPSIDLPAAQKKRTSIKNCPTVASWEEATEARLNLLDHLVQQRNSISQEKRDPSDQEKWLEQRLRHQVKGILRDISPSAPLPEQLHPSGSASAIPLPAQNKFSYLE